MAISRQKKEEILITFKDNLSKGKILVFVNFKDMNVADVTSLRNMLREEGGSMQVLKKTLIQRVLDEQNIALDARSFEGEVAAVFGFEDEVGVVKVLDKFAKATKRPEFHAGIMGSILLSDVELKQLASIPSREELLAKAVGSIAAPMSGIVNVFVGNVRNLVYALNAIGQKKKRKTQPLHPKQKLQKRRR